MATKRPSETAATIAQHEEAWRVHESLANLARDTGTREEEQAHRAAAAVHVMAYEHLKKADKDKAWLQDALRTSKAARRASERVWTLVDNRHAKRTLPKLTPGAPLQPDPGTKASTADDHFQACRMHYAASAAAGMLSGEVAKAHERAAARHSRAAKALSSHDHIVRASGAPLSKVARDASASAWAVVRTYGGTPSPDAAATIRSQGAWRVRGEMFTRHADACAQAVGLALQSEQTVAIEHLVSGKVVDVVTVEAQPEEVE